MIDGINHDFDRMVISKSSLTIHQRIGHISEHRAFDAIIRNTLKSNDLFDDAKQHLLVIMLEQAESKQMQRLIDRPNELRFYLTSICQNQFRSKQFKSQYTMCGYQVEDDHMDILLNKQANEPAEVDEQDEVEMNKQLVQQFINRIKQILIESNIEWYHSRLWLEYHLDYTGLLETEKKKNPNAKMSQRFLAKQTGISKTTVAQVIKQTNELIHKEYQRRYGQMPKHLLYRNYGH